MNSAAKNMVYLSEFPLSILLISFILRHKFLAVPYQMIPGHFGWEVPGICHPKGCLPVSRVQKKINEQIQDHAKIPAAETVVS